MLTYNLIKNNLDLSKKIYIAFSGGPDSTALLHLISKMKTDFEIKPQAIHINHNLSNQSGKWAEHCKNICMNLDIDLLTESIEIRSEGGGIESAARQSRQKFGKLLDLIPNCDDVVKLKALCRNCREQDAIFTYRLSKEKEQTVVGVDNYVSLCRGCYNKGLIGPVKTIYGQVGESK